MIEWLVEVHMKFKLLPETLFLTVNIIDRFTQIQQVCRTDYQLLGVAAMLIAAKYEEIYAPEIGDFVYMTDNAYTRERILQMQSEVLQRLDFNVTVPCRFGYLERFVKLSHSDDLVMNFARYITELSLMQVELHKWRPSQIAAAAIYVARKVLKRPEPWSPLMCQQTSYDEKAVRACAKELCLVINAA